MRDRLLVSSALLALLLAVGLASSSGGVSSSATEIEPTQRWHVPCSAQYAENGLVEGCHPTDCKRVIHDNFIARAEVDRLILIADTAMAQQAASLAGGPCIADINSGGCVGASGLGDGIAGRINRRDDL